MVRDFGSYSDEFGSPDDPAKKFMGIAGLLAWSDKWKVFTEEWEECLSREKVPRPFHMTDFIHHTQKFSDTRWEDQGERVRVLGLLLKIVEKVDPIPIGAAVDLRDYRALTLEQQKKCKSPYYLAFQTVTSNIGFCAGSIDLTLGIERARDDMLREKAGLPLQDYDWATPSAVSMVYAKLKKFTGPAEEVWNGLKSVNAFGRWMSSYTPGEPADYPPLQAADIWAYCLGHVGEHKEPKIEVKNAFKVFSKQMRKSAYGHHGFTFINRRQILIDIGEYPDWKNMLDYLHANKKDETTQ